MNLQTNDTWTLFQVHVAYEHHRYLIGRSGETVRSLMQAHDVNISIPHQDKHLDEITVTGQAENVEEVVADILKMVTKLEESAEDRVSWHSDNVGYIAPHSGYFAQTSHSCQSLCNGTLIKRKDFMRK